MSKLRPAFWKTVPLTEMTSEEWEALCDGCGKCCVLKLEDEDTGRVHYTDVACRLFDDSTCRCSQYALRQSLVQGCVVITPDNLPQIRDWMPRTCAYRRLSYGEGLPTWHPLLTGRADSPRRSGNSMHHATVPEWEVDEDDLEDHIIWRDI
ncbi:YcgN family cysteine cluster protein [Oceanicella sp. SM1341]|uniref:YcgN family cysteine cluster protein n=1 Tax=Oceanicella sp. SM1341 TaxID=1548889 RepID=UPI000E489A9E|nr:YcgN family cysteine cluster protein [Oceanicella sp. SM1341]